ncbi:carbonic anhydrase 14-like [Mustelus asterias]
MKMLAAGRVLALGGVFLLLWGAGQSDQGTGVISLSCPFPKPPQLPKSDSFQPRAPVGSHWTYEGAQGPEFWKKDYPHCGQESQSPINIDTEVVTFAPSLKDIQLAGYRKPNISSFSLSNNGHTVQLDLPSSMCIASLSSRYSAAQLHFHWGNDTARTGSEHRVNGMGAPAEMHVVHYNSEKYPNAKEAMREEDGLVVLGILLEVGDKNNPAYENILSHLESVAFAGQQVTIPSFDVQSLLPTELGKYFTYSGSLTTPPCYQSVHWIIFHQRVRLSLSQVGPLISAKLCKHC